MRPPTLLLLPFVQTLLGKRACRSSGEFFMMILSMIVVLSLLLHPLSILAMCFLSRTSCSKNWGLLVLTARCRLRMLQTRQQLYSDSLSLPHFSNSVSTITVSGFHLPALKTTGFLTGFFALVFGSSLTCSEPSESLLTRFEARGESTKGPSDGCLRFLPSVGCVNGLKSS